MRFSIHLVLFLTCLASSHMFAQLQAAKWCFGENGGLDFSSGKPEGLFGCQIETAEGSASISDKDGNLLFYTDGITVWNRMHQPMTYGLFLRGHKSTSQVLIIPKPNDDNIYYIITATPQAGIDYGADTIGLHYSIIDISLENGLGKVISKNNLLMKETTEKMTAVFHANSNDIWLVVHEWGNANFRSYLVSSEGLDSSNFVVSKSGLIHQNGGPPIFGKSPNYNAIGYMKFSPSGKKLANVVYAEKKIQIFDFNNQNGSVSESVLTFDVGDGRNPYATEFSPDGNKLYFTDPAGACTGNIINRVVQIDLLTNNVTDVGTFEGTLFGMQLAIDGRIYVTKCNQFRNETNNMAVIRNPNRSGKDCGFDLNGPSIGNGKNVGGLPGFIQSFFDFGNPIINMPNVFTPNKDQFNRLFRPKSYENILESQMKIYNRWGNLVYETSDLNIGWDGGTSPDGIYFWVIYYEGINGKLGSMKGWVHRLSE